MTKLQPGILDAIPAHSRYLDLRRRAGDELAREALGALAGMSVASGAVVGLGPGLLKGLGVSVPGHVAFPALCGPGCEVPSTQSDLWVWVRGEDRGDILKRARAIEIAVGDAFEIERMVDGFRHLDGRDLTGYEDGTENPKGDDAVDVASGSSGASFVAVQQWLHDLELFASHPQGRRDGIIGRRLSDNAELADAPASAHVKRTAQESFKPEAFVLRRSMPWADTTGEGLMFVAFGKSLDAFVAQMRRMAGLDDGIVDALFGFTRPLTGSMFWCPPVRGGRLDLPDFKG